MNVDTLMGVLTGVLAICAFLLHTLSDPTSTKWITFPPFIRWGLVATGGAFMVRSVNLFSISERPPEAAGHLNWEALAVTIALVYTVGGFTYLAAARSLRGHSWERLQWLFGETRRNPDQTPLLVPSDKIVAIARADGQPTYDGMGLTPDDLAREGRRYQAAIARKLR